MKVIPKYKLFTGLLGWLGITFLAAAIAATASVDAGSFYGELVLPDWAPPSWVFGPVWTVLYALMGISAWLIWRVEGFGPARITLGLFIIQLAVNALWSWLFFAWHLGGLAFADILLLDLLIAAILIGFWSIRRIAGVLLVPYLLWSGFATVLNFAVWQLNPDLLG